MKSPKMLSVFLFLIATTIVSAQVNNKSKKQTNDTIDLVLVYEQYVKDGYGTPAIYKKLANSNYFDNNYRAAKKWFEKLFETEKPMDPKHKQRYIQSLRALKIDLEKSQYLSIATSEEY